MEMVLHLKRQSRNNVFVSKISVEKYSDWKSLKTVSVYSINKIPTGKIEKQKLLWSRFGILEKSLGVDDFE